MFDSNLHTCWNSDQGDLQFIFFEFAEPVALMELKIMFQGGFVAHDWSVEFKLLIAHKTYASDCQLSFRSLVECGETSTSLQPFYHIQTIGDNNDLQHFEMPLVSPPVFARYVRLTFKEFSDFYGRMIIYNFEVHGVRQQQPHEIAG